MKLNCGSPTPLEATQLRECAGFDRPPKPARELRLSPNFSVGGPDSGVWHSYDPTLLQRQLEGVSSQLPPSCRDSLVPVLCSPEDFAVHHLNAWQATGGRESLHDTPADVLRWSLSQTQAALEQAGDALQHLAQVGSIGGMGLSSTCLTPSAPLQLPVSSLQGLLRQPSFKALAMPITTHSAAEASGVVRALSKAGRFGWLGPSGLHDEWLRGPGVALLAQDPLTQRSASAPSEAIDLVEWPVSNGNDAQSVAAELQASRQHMHSLCDEYLAAAPQDKDVADAVQWLRAFMQNRVLKPLADREHNGAKLDLRKAWTDWQEHLADAGSDLADAFEEMDEEVMQATQALFTSSTRQALLNAGLRVQSSLPHTSFPSGLHSLMDQADLPVTAAVVEAAPHDASLATYCFLPPGADQVPTQGVARADLNIGLHWSAARAWAAASR